MIIENKQIETIKTEKPKTITPKNICYWYEEWGILDGSQRSKAIKFLENNCIEKSIGNEFICKPIKGYNKTTHSILKDLNGNYHCTCQFSSKYNKECSHIIAVKLFQFINNWNNK